MTDESLPKLQGTKVLKLKLSLSLSLRLRLWLQLRHNQQIQDQLPWLAQLSEFGAATRSVA